MNIAVIGDSNSLITDILLKALIKVIKENKDFKLVAIIDANKLPAIKSSPIRVSSSTRLKSFSTLLIKMYFTIILNHFYINTVKSSQSLNLTG